MLKRSHLSLTLALAMLFAVLVGAPAQSATKPFYFWGAAGGSQIAALGTTISSDLTGSSSVSGFDTPQNDTNRTAGVKVRGVLTLGAVSTWAKASDAGEGTRILTGGRTADINLLNGLITADAVETNAVSTLRPGGVSTSRAFTEFVNLRIGGEKIPVNVEKNTTISIPGVLLVVLNGHQQADFGGGIVTQGFGLYAKLLSNQGRLALGAEILLNPTINSVTPTPPGQVPQLGGMAYGTNVKANIAGDLAQLDVGPTAALIMPMIGTDGKVARNTTATADAQSILHTGEVRSTGFGATGKRRSISTMTNQIVDLDVLDTLVTADAIKVTSTAKKRPALFNGVRKSMAMTFVNLKVLGTAIPIDVSPNTKITVMGGLLGNEPIAEVTINKRTRNKVGSTIIGLEVKLLSDRGALKTGAIVEIAVASSWIFG
ncbi:MAG TPA: choice-of-anchor P family protein [Nocardioidaceae bacterium]|nr:choice-of-anchor P family protein [Nocardioidaceae bacterium]